jgi:acetyl esterase
LLHALVPCKGSDGSAMVAAKALPPGIADDEAGWFARQRIGLERSMVRRVLRSPGWVTRLAGTRRAPRDGRSLDPQMAALLRLDDLQSSSDLRGLSPGRARRRVYESILAVNDAGPPEISARDEPLAHAGATSRVRVYEAPAPDPRAAAWVYIHGGGWVTGSVASHDSLCRRIAAALGCKVVSLRYRLAPEHPFPAAVDDCLSGWAAVMSHAERLGIDASRVIVAGDSAGGNLAAVIAQRTAGSAAAPALQVLLYAALDGRRRQRSYQSVGDRYLLTTPMVDWYYDRYLGKGSVDDPDLSPLLRPDLSKVAPALVYSCGFDPLRDESAEYADRLRQADVDVYHRCFDSLPHGFALISEVPAARHALDVVLGDVSRKLR